MANNNILAGYGYPSQKQITNQARNLASASVTPASQIRKQYARSQTDASGFTQALISLLGGQQAQYNSAANDATTQQAAIDSAAASRLGGVAPEFQGAQVATGALGDSAAARQVSQGEALKGYGAQQPGIAASRGALAQVGLTNAMQDALSQRRTALQQAFQQALPQVQQNALGMATAAANIRQNQQNLAYQYASLAQNNSQFQQSQAQQASQFNYVHSPAYQKMIANLSGGGSSALAGLSPHEVIGYQGDIANAIDTAKRGVPLTDPSGKIIPGQWKVPPAPNGAPNEPNQANSIFYMYNFLKQRFPEPLVLGGLRAAYGNNAWTALVKQLYPDQWRKMQFGDVARAAKQAGRAPFGKQQGPKRGP